MMHQNTNGPQAFQAAENPDASVQNDEVDMDQHPVSAAPTGNGKRTKVVSRIKLSNFNPEEDVNLVKSWLEISCDPIASTGQRKDRMWNRILHRYNLRRGTYPERSVRSLQSRWDKIKAEVGKFASFYADAIRENSTGMSDADKTTHAAANFAGVLKHNFAYLHCWEIMKDEPKWQDPNPQAMAQSAGGDGFGEAAINLVEFPAGGDGFGEAAINLVEFPAGGDGFGEAAINLEDGNSNPTGSADKRPKGKDSAKAAKEKANSPAGSTSSSKYASRMQDLSLQKISIMQEESVRKNDRFQQLASIDEKRFEEMRSYNQSLLCIEQEKIRIMREKHDMDKKKKERQEDERILGIDLDGCTQAQRVYYQALQEEILEKIAARRRKRQAP